MSYIGNSSTSSSVDGVGCTVFGKNVHAEGLYCIAVGDDLTVSGTFNIKSSEKISIPMDFTNDIAIYVVNSLEERIEFYKNIKNAPISFIEESEKVLKNLIKEIRKVYF